MNRKTFLILMGVLVFLLAFFAYLAFTGTEPPSTQHNISLKYLSNDYTVYSWAGWYARDRVTIRMKDISTFEDYLLVSVHEYGHAVMDRDFTKDELKAWYIAIDKCGYQSTYAKTYRSRTVRMMEEWADNLAYYYTGKATFCPEKTELLKKYATRNNTAG